MRRLSRENQDRLKSALGVALFHALIGYAILTGLGFQLPVSVEDEMKLIDIRPDLPPPPNEPALPEIAKPSGSRRRIRKARPRPPTSRTRRPRSSRPCR
jgi:hypothetical protein